MQIREDGTPDAAMAAYLERDAWMAHRKEDGTPHVFVNRLRVPVTRSGAAVLAEATDDEALALVPGDVVLVAIAPGSMPVISTLVPVRVLAVRRVAWELDEEPIEVPVVDLEMPSGKRVAHAVGDVVVVRLLVAAGSVVQSHAA